MAIVLRLDRMMADRKVSLGELAEKVGIADGNLSKLKNGKVSGVRFKTRNAIWDSAGEYVSDNTLSVYVKRLRDKVEDDPAEPRLILTVRGLGYRTGA